MVIYLDEETQHYTQSDIQNIQIHLLKKNLYANRLGEKNISINKKPPLAENGTHYLTKKTLELGCNTTPKEYYQYRVNNFVSNHDALAIVAVNTRNEGTGEKAYPFKAFIPLPNICGYKGLQGQIIQFKGQYLEDVQTVRLKTDQGELELENVVASEDGSQMYAVLPPETDNILGVSGVTCKGQTLLAYKNQGFQVASEGLPQGPVCGCADCHETDFFQLPPLISNVEAIENEGERKEPKLRVTLQHCEPNNCWIAFEKRIDGSAIREKVTIQENTVNASNEPVQIVEVTIPNQAKVGGDIYAISNTTPGNVWKGVTTACNMYQGSNQNFVLASESNCRQQAAQAAK